jgi:peptidoglycan/LPS O-acetylase OafA/YrhL
LDNTVPALTALPAGPANRVYGLDILRAVAILTVVYLHGYAFVARYLPGGLYAALIPDGVNLFFVLSGYLIGGILLKLLAAGDFGPREAGAFWLRRWLRTLPGYYLLVALLFAAALLHLQAPPPHLRTYLLFLQNIAWPHPGFFSEAWSLSIEEWFYLLLPAALLLSVRWIRREHRETLLLAWTIAAIVAVTLFRARVAGAHGFPDATAWDDWLRKTVACRLDAIGFGVVGAWARRRHPKIWQRHARLLFWAGLSLLAFQQAQFMLIRNSLYLNYVALTLAPLAALLLLPALSAIRSGQGRAYRCVTFVSTISYPMYLVNLSAVQMTLMPLLFGARVLDPPSLPAAIGAWITFWLLTLGLAILIHLCYEKPIMDWRDRRFAAQASAAYQPV